jgi:hypothetical protein
MEAKKLCGCAFKTNIQNPRSHFVSKIVFQKFVKWLGTRRSNCYPFVRAQQEIAYMTTFQVEQQRQCDAVRLSDMKASTNWCGVLSLDSFELTTQLCV